MTWHTIRYDAIENFRRSWPAHGLPDELESLSVETASNGDVVDIEAYTSNEAGDPVQIEWREFDGSAFAALVQDCIQLGDIADGSEPAQTVTLGPKP